MLVLSTAGFVDRWFCRLLVVFVDARADRHVPLTTPADRHVPLTTSAVNGESTSMARSGSLCFPALVLCTGVLCALQGVHTFHMRQDPALSGRRFTTDVLFDLVVRSKSHCAALCQRSNKCSAVSVTSLVSSSARPLLTCRGYFKTKTSSSTYVFTSGLVNFLLKTEAPCRPQNAETCSSWLGKSCLFPAMCSASNADCLGFKCTCHINYYYSFTVDTCVESCSELQDGYTFHDNTDMWGSDLSKTQTTEQECQESCSSRPECRSYVYWKVWPYDCVLKNMAPSTDTPTYFNSFTFLKKRMCA